MLAILALFALAFLAVGATYLIARVCIAFSGPPPSRLTPRVKELLRDRHGWSEEQIAALEATKAI